MTDAPTKTREQELLEEFKAGLEPDAVATLVAALEAERDKVNAHASELADQVVRLKNQVEALQGDADAANVRAEKAEMTAKSAKASVKQGDHTASPRKLKKMDDGLTGDELTEALAAADADDKTVEIVPTSNGREIAGVAPTVVQGEVWREHSRGKMLRDPITVKGPAEGAGFAIDGYALLIDGKQVAYQARPEPVRVAAGQSVSLQDDIWF